MPRKNVINSKVESIKAKLGGAGCAGSEERTNLLKQGLRQSARLTEILAESDKNSSEFIRESGSAIIEEKFAGQSPEKIAEAESTLRQLAQRDLTAAALWLVIVYENGPRPELLGDNFISNVSKLDSASLNALFYAASWHNNAEMLGHQRLYTKEAVAFTATIGPEAASEFYNTVAEFYGNAAYVGNVDALASIEVLGNQDVAKLALDNAGLASELFKMKNELQLHFIEAHKNQRRTQEAMAYAAIHIEVHVEKEKSGHKSDNSRLTITKSRYLFRRTTAHINENIQVDGLIRITWYKTTYATGNGNYDGYH